MNETIKDVVLSTSGKTHDGKSRYVINIPTRNFNQIRGFGDDEVLIKIKFGSQKNKSISFVRQISKTGVSSSGSDKKMIIISSKFVTPELEKSLGDKVDISIEHI